MSADAQVPKRDRLGVGTRPDAAAMTYLLLCPWCEDESAFDGELDDELTCRVCGLSIGLATDSAEIELPLQEAA